MATTGPALKKTRDTLINIGCVAMIVLVLAAIAIPDFNKFQRKAGQYNEVKSNLGSIYLSQLDYRKIHGRFAGGQNAFQLLRWSPAGQTLFAYFCGDDYLPNTKGSLIAEDVKNWLSEARPYTTPTRFVCTAVGNIDNDPDLDYWTIDDQKNIRNISSDL